MRKRTRVVERISWKPRTCGSTHDDKRRATALRCSTGESLRASTALRAKVESRPVTDARLLTLSRRPVAEDRDTSGSTQDEARADVGARAPIPSRGSQRRRRLRAADDSWYEDFIEDRINRTSDTRPHIEPKESNSLATGMTSQACEFKPRVATKRWRATSRRSSFEPRDLECGTDTCGVDALRRSFFTHRHGGAPPRLCSVHEGVVGWLFTRSREAW